MDDAQYELSMLMKMEPYELRLHLIEQDLSFWRSEFTRTQAELSTLHAEENYFIAMGKKYLKYYNEDNLEADWGTAEQYIELARNIKTYRAWLRESLPEITEWVRRYKREWEQVKKMMELQQKLTQEPPKN